MAKLFISHSSKDKVFARQLANDLKEFGHSVWLDEWEIRVGDCIVAKVEQGLGASDYVVLVLSANAVASGWVEKEWRTKYWEEISNRRAIVLPVLVEDCDIPLLLKTKKYADFRTNARAGLAQLVLAIEPVTMSNDSAITISPVIPKTDDIEDITRLLEKLHSGSIPLSAALAEALTLARRRSHAELASFCQSELIGYEGRPNPEPSWRLAQAYVSPTAQLNPQYIGFSGNAAAAFSAMEKDREHFAPKRIALLMGVPEIEGRPTVDPTKSLLSLTMAVSDFMEGSSVPDAPVFVYVRGDTFSSILTSIRIELTRRLLKLLPEPKETK
jgi:hypothetical protein